MDSHTAPRVRPRAACHVAGNARAKPESPARQGALLLNECVDGQTLANPGSTVKEVLGGSKERTGTS